MHGERLVNNTKQPRQTNIAFGFTGDTRALVALLPVRKVALSCEHATPLDDSVEMLQAQRDDRQRERKADKDRTPAIYLAVGLTWSGNFVAGAYRDVLSRLLFRFVGLALPREAFNTIFLVLVMPRCNLV